ncbi:MAG: hypothetical protein ABFE01_28490 [Phycisphaerales bacterium]|jgi:hypothetical protein
MTNHLTLGLFAGFVFLSLGVPEASALGSKSARVAKLKVNVDMAKDGSYQSGPWTYEYSTTLKGSRSEGYHGKLSFQGKEVPQPANLNDYYETPWGPIYWVGRPAVLFGYHGWMSKPVTREPKGQALMDPAKLAKQVFTVQVKVLASEELATPDRIEKDAKALTALKPFELKEAHVQRTWFGLGQTWNSLHDTKLWGHLEVRVAAPDPNRPLALEFRSTGDFTVTTPDQLNSIAALIPPDRSGNSEFVKLPPQPGVVRAIKCTLTPVVGDPLDLFLVCEVKASRKK